jgi:hypothetical protein
MSHRGTATLEASLTAVLLGVIICGGFFLVGVSLARHWIDYVVDEAVVCLDSGIERSRCRKRALEQMRVLRFGEIKRFAILSAEQTGLWSQVRIDFEIQKPRLLDFISEKTWVISREASGHFTGPLP